MRTFNVAEIAHLRPVFDLLDFCEMFIAVKVGFLSLGRVEKHVADTALVLVRLATFHVLFFFLDSRRTEMSHAVLNTRS